MSALPGYIIRGCVNTLFLSIRKHLNVRTSALIESNLQNSEYDYNFNYMIHPAQENAVECTHDLLILFI